MHEVKAPVQVKKTKKKPKTDVKPVPVLSTSEGKEPDDGMSPLMERDFFFKLSFPFQAIYSDLKRNHA